MEPGETPEEAAIREAREETGLGVTLTGKLCLFDNGGRTEHYFLATNPRGEQSIGGPERERMSPENRYELEWITVERLRDVNLRPARIIPVCEDCVPRRGPSASPRAT